MREAALLVGVAVVTLLSALSSPPGRTPMDPLGYLLLAAGVAVLPLRALGGRAPASLRRWAPILTVYATCVLMLAYQARAYPGVSAAVPALVAVYAAVLAGHRAHAAVAVAAGFVPLRVIDLIASHGQLDRNVLQQRFLLLGWLVAAGVFGEVTRHRNAYLRQVEQRAADAERTREETARRRAGEERLRIARELHDSLTHSISIIAVQAGVGIHLARKRAEPVPDALLAIQEASGDAMRELRSTLEVLRADADGPENADEPAGTGLDRLDDLVERARMAGLATTVTVSGQPRALPPVVDRTAYRIVQEALTNVAKHAGPASAAVHMSYGDEALTVQVDDDGQSPDGQSLDGQSQDGQSQDGQSTVDDNGAHGVGLRGMRERISALGGSLRAGPRPAGGFSVHAELPLPAPVAAGHAHTTVAQ
jgi:signal transduction histidine kinase